MYIETQLLTKEQAQQAIEQFVQQHRDAHYYMETVTEYVLQPVAQLEVPTAFHYIRLFSKQEDLQIRQLQGGYQLVRLSTKESTVQLQFERSRTLLLDSNYAGTYKKLVVDQYEHAQHGTFEHWKEVVR